MQIVVPTQHEFEQISRLIRQFELDDRQLHHQQFLAGFIQKELVGFGRLRTHDTCTELCSLGVAEPQRFKGIGTQLVKELIAKATKPLYLVCIIPDYFKPFGFSRVNSYPAELQDKLDYCTAELLVPETYVVMKHRNSYTKNP